MKNLLKHLNQIADRWMDTLDNELQMPIVRTITGDVFKHDPERPNHVPTMSSSWDADEHIDYAECDMTETPHPLPSSPTKGEGEKINGAAEYPAFMRRADSNIPLG